MFITLGFQLPAKYIIHAFLMENELEIYLVVFDTISTELGERLYPGLEAYIDHHYVLDKREELDFENLQKKIDERMKHLSDTFSEYLLYLIEKKGLDNVEVYQRAIVDKKIFSKIMNNRNYHPQKMTALCLCIGEKLSMDEAKELLVRAGFALSLE